MFQSQQSFRLSLMILKFQNYHLIQHHLQHFYHLYHLRFVSKFLSRFGIHEHNQHLESPKCWSPQSQQSFRLSLMILKFQNDHLQLLHLYHLRFVSKFLRHFGIHEHDQHHPSNPFHHSRPPQLQQLFQLSLMILNIHDHQTNLHHLYHFRFVSKFLRHFGIHELCP